ncbi:beta-glucosidase [Alternaria panax]|uniref:Probable beta-glucosidase I n=1 Tax=Alternaria panax TaxID=48097 RepID=A0AAD4NU34_9PLEO|nr:beta-glucosidase [Alternaria panax]
MALFNDENTNQEHTKPFAPFDVEEVLLQLNIDEKVSLLSGKDFWHTRDIPRLSIPSIRLSDGPNGIRGTKFFGSVPSACLPCGTAIGATFDSDLVVEIGHLLGDEARAKGAHVVLGPTINIQRGPLGGRGFESYSEDPFLSGMLAANYVNGLKDKHIGAAIKHLVCNDQEHERMAVNTIITQRALREIYLLPFMLATRHSNPVAIMTAYNRVNGVHVAEDRSILRDIVRNEWRWDGLFVSDWFGTYSTSEAINAGLDLEMPGPSRWRGSALVHAVSANKVLSSELDERVRAVLKLVKKSAQARIPQNAPETQLNRPADQRLLRKVAADSIVLLKNQDNVLPLSPNRKIAVIGPNAKIATYCGGGSASLNAYSTSTPLNGVKSLAKGDMDFSQGAYAFQMLPELGEELTVDGNPGFKLRFFNDPPTNADRTPLEERTLTDSNIFFLDYDHPDLKEIWYAETEGLFTPTESGIYDFGLCVHGTGRLYIDDGLLVSNVENQRPGPSFLGSGTLEETGAKVLVAGRSYRITVQWGCAKTSTRKTPGTVDFGHGGLRFGSCLRQDAQKLIDAAVRLASEVDQVVICVGLGPEWESEGDDRVSMDLPPNTDTLVEQVLEANPNAAIVVQSGTPIAMPWGGKAKAILHAWYGGNEGGNAIADILFGAVNPSGKLPLTFPHRLKDNPTYLNYRSEGGRVLYGEDVYVGYRFYEQTEVAPLFPFGHGLSYTTFALSNLNLDMDMQTEWLSVRCTVSNTGSRAGAEVVQVYITPVSPPIRRPLKELKGFAKHYIEAGQSVEVVIRIDVLRDTSFWEEKEGSKRIQDERSNIPLPCPTSFVAVQQGAFRTDSICSRALLRIMVDDYLLCIYPLIPVVHRPSFFFALNEDRDNNDEDFLGLLVAVLDRCHGFLTALRRPDFFEKIGFSKWAASYLMAIAFFQVGKQNHARMIEVESMQLGRLLDLHRVDKYEELDCIEKQLRKKGFWLLFYGYVHSEVQNFRKEKLSFLDHATMATTNLKALMPIPVEDEQIFKHETFSSPTSEVSMTTGFIIHSRLFWQAIEDPHDSTRRECLCCRDRSPAAQAAHFRHRLRDLKYALDDAPRPFRQYALTEFDTAPHIVSSSQLGTLRANIHVTHLWLQSMLLDQLDLLNSPEQHWHEREDISTQLLHVLHNTPQAEIEPNGLHLVYKVRDVAVGLLACPYEAPDSSAKRAQEYVKAFTDIMARLDASETVNTANLQSWIDTGRQGG